MVGVSLICREILLQLRRETTSLICILFCDEGSFLARCCVGHRRAGLHRHFKSIFISPLSERTGPVKGGYGGEKIGGKVAWTIFFLFIYLLCW